MTDLHPSGTVTFLFTDVVDSSLWWRDRETDMRTALRIHDATVADVFDQHGGYVFARAGDSFAVAFESAPDAVLAAIAVQPRVSEAEAPIDLRVRIGVATGNADERDGDYFGSSVNRAARIMSLAHGGQVLVSRATADLARETIAGDVELHEIGAVALRGVGTESIEQAFARGLGRDFPPIRTIDHRSLPTPLTGLIGREREVAALCETVGEHRLVTVVGIGGTGKTRLAIAAAERLGDGFDDGVVFVELAAIASDQEVPRAVARAAGISAAGAGGAIDERVIDALAGRSLLIVLDNCEHLLFGVAEFAENLIAASGAVHLLATSREAIDIDGEQAIPLRPLALDAEVGKSPAVELLIQRALGAGTDPQRIADVAVLDQICRQLDGIPLAIELAAAQLVHLDATDLAKRLDQRFELLVGGRSRRRQRHHTLAAVMDWSWDLLGTAQQRLLAELSMFPDGCTLEIAEGSCSGEPGRPVVSILGELTAKSLVVSRTGHEGVRYSLLETVRLYAARQLVAMGIAEQSRQRLSDWLVEWHEELNGEQGLLSRTSQQYERDIELSWWAANWTLERGEAEKAALLVGYGALALVASTSPLALRFLHLADEIDTTAVSGRARTLIHMARSWDAFRSGDYPRMLKEGRLAHDGAVDNHMTGIEATTLLNTGAIMLFTEPEHGLATIQQGLDKAVAANLPRLAGHAAGLLVTSDLFLTEDAPPFTAERFGGLGTIGSHVALTAYVAHHASRGEVVQAEHHLDLLVSTDGMRGRRATNEIALRAFVAGFTADPADALDTIRNVATELKRFYELFFQGELWLAAGAALARRGDLDAALECLVAASRSSMYLPCYYFAWSRIDTSVRAQIDDDARLQVAAERGNRIDITDIAGWLSAVTHP